MEGLIPTILSTSGDLLVASFQGFDFNFVKRFSNLFLVMRCVHVLVVGRLFRFDGGKMLEMLRGKRLVFVGDSLNRNMWESLVCALRDSLKDKSRVYEVSGRQRFRTQGFYSFKFRVSL